jgi:CRP-like cAMP-binding protein
MDPKHKLSQFIQNVFPMQENQVATITDLFSERKFNKHDMLLQEKTVCNEYYFLNEGLIRAYTYDLDGNDITTGFYSSGQVACELFSFFKRIPTRENFVALSDCRVLYISYSDLQNAFHSMPHFREFGRSILINAYAGLKQRMLSTLHETAEERYLRMLNSNPDIFQHAPLKTVASYLGITDSSLSRIRKEAVGK